MTVRARPQPKVTGRSERAVQEALEAQRRSANIHPLSEAELVENIEISGGGAKTTVQHHLGRKPKRVLAFVPHNATTAPLFEVVSSRTETTFELGNNGANAVTVDVLVM